MSFANDACVKRRERTTPGGRRCLLTLLALLGLHAKSLQAAEKAPPFPLRLRDGLGVELTLTRAPQRILSGSLASDEILLALAARACQVEPSKLTASCDAAKRIVGVSTLADDVRYSNVVPIPAFIGARFGGEVESALAQRPDLVILASYNRPEFLERFRRAGVPVFVLQEFRSFADIAQHISWLGDLMQLRQEAAEMRAAFEGELQKFAPLAEKRPRVSQLFLDGTVSGRNTLFDAIVSAAGAINAAAEQGHQSWPRLTGEALAKLDPDCFVVAGHDDDAARLLAAARATPGFSHMKAARAPCAIAIPEQHLSAVSQHVSAAVARLHASLRERGLLAAAPPPPSQAPKPMAKGAQP